MKLVAWNCQMTFRNKFEALNYFNADIWVIPESESPDQLALLKKRIPASSHCWVGKNEHKGLSVFTKADWKAEILDWHNQDYRFVVPLAVSSPKRTFTLIAVWTQEVKPQKDSYVVQANRALEEYGDWLSEDTILIGDFNSNKIWDNQKRESNHTDLVESLGRRGFRSVYHGVKGEDQGEETDPTIYWRRKLEDPYHVDHAFLHECVLSSVRNFEVGKADDWLGLSDHMPLILDVEI